MIREAIQTGDAPLPKSLDSRFLVDLSNPTEFLVTTPLNDGSILVSIDYITPSNGYVGSHSVYCAPPIAPGRAPDGPLFQMKNLRHCPICVNQNKSCTCRMDDRIARWAAVDLMSTRPSSWPDLCKQLLNSPRVEKFVADLHVLSYIGEIVYTIGDIQSTLLVGDECPALMPLTRKLLERLAKQEHKWSFAEQPKEPKRSETSSTSSRPRARGKAVTCPHCSLVFTRKDNYARHCREVHMGCSRRSATSSKSGSMSSKETASSTTEMMVDT
eukprot:CAMPEP_0198309740 /NCGR_PEP_ID=MMETSP1450-20131203/2026_1 /TAXON_ID=753684 ORGANISM="Madagascaria erythrocladiodes, Strain CCMP3234" /NCGR_SAMPLE_ID=MMETSP1450 /ASSEMBLY_ACC=CAM_ASM_001115 /LENGTH=270 /DNA_ID=CAMNT_0044012513 /DNA_START=297 /DNA_END=1109 /DNA_ORIENTATION=-